MSAFLRDALRHRAQTASGSTGGDAPRSALHSRESAKSTARSFASVGLTLASVFSTSGKPKKRRRPPVSQLGVPEFYQRDPPPARPPEGVELLPADDYGFDGTAHSKVLKDRSGKPWISLVLWSHAGPRSAVPLYYENETVRGELRVHFDRTESFNEVSVWLLGTVYERGAHGPKILSQQACVWPPHGKPQSLFSRKLKVKGTHVWVGGDPITFQLPPDVAVFSELAQAASGKVEQSPYRHYDVFMRCWGGLGPGSSATLTASMLSKLTGFGVEVAYTVTVDMDRSKERQIGIQHPATFGPGDCMNFKLMISSSNPEFADLMTSPLFVRAELARTVIVGDGALNASYGTHDRSLYPLFSGRLWKEGEDPTGGRRDSTSTPSLEEDVDFSSPVIREPPKPRVKPARQPAPLSPLPEPETATDSSSESGESEEQDVGLGSGKVVRMEGRIQLPTGRMMKPSFRFSGVAIEYLIVVTFTPPEYRHISPRGIFQAECPVWLCSDWQSYQPPRGVPGRAGGGSMNGETIDVSGARVVREQEVIGVVPARERRTRY
ncbi:hypothetical protein CALVIDRAFT_560333 [Calocera viscosa TUFC12733]|uniref:Arrestin-like N-terminal domain-containing protein n=1 Tax=Calocera viscosa (strain TUFC12733) TaxID=1330018 RepID=A0A167QXB0_CALVF|nr:hypothetical protein CALVIDRAFT_560333 [Calocera viscosa TUFC12733]